MSTMKAQSIVPLHAGFWRRGAASVVDSLVLFVPNLLVTLAFPDLVGLLLQMAIGVAYFSLMHASASQATVGKRAFGIKVTDLEGNRIGFGRALARVPAMWLSGVILGIGFLMAAFTGRKQALHDMICGTLVVNRGAEPAAVAAGGDTMPLTGGVWAVVVLLLVLPFFGGMLAAIAIPAYQDYTIRAKVAQVINEAMALRRTVETAHQSKRSWPTGPQPVASPFVRSAEIDSEGRVVMTVADEVVRGGRIHFTPSESGGAIQWQCSASDIAPRYLPQACR